VTPLVHTENALTVRCSKGTTYTVYLVSPSTVAASGVRELSATGGEKLQYTLTAVDGTTVVNNTAAFATALRDSNAAIPLPVKVTVAAEQNVTAGAEFSETVTSNINF
jgi:spore coat protein U-like protein